MPEPTNSVFPELRIGIMHTPIFSKITIDGVKLYVRRLTPTGLNEALTGVIDRHVFENARANADRVYDALIRVGGQVRLVPASVVYAEILIDPTQEVVDTTVATAARHRRSSFGFREIVGAPFTGLSLADLSEDAVRRMGFNHHAHALNAVKKAAREQSVSLEYARAEGHEEIPVSVVEEIAKKRALTGR